tara:strand:- start:1876 stop:2112 length:237 start_codon:yes stop_codon:yes gene_type:complete
MLKLKVDGFDEAIIGIAERCGYEPVFAYDYDQCIKILQDQGMSREGALEFFEYNTLGSWLGDTTPVFITKQSFTSTKK